MEFDMQRKPVSGQPVILPPIIQADNDTLKANFKNPGKPIVAREFNGTDTDSLSINENYRYLRNSNKVGHALITKNENGESIAMQYSIPPGTGAETPLYRPLINIESIDRYGMHDRYRASTPGGTPMFATRFIEGEFGAADSESIRIACFSPPPTGKSEPFWGSGDKELPLFRSDLKGRVKKDLNDELKELKPYSKGGEELEVDHESVAIRDANKTRTPDQNTVMGGTSAKDTYEAFLNQYKGELTDEMIQQLKKSVEAPLKASNPKESIQSHYRPEWLHAFGFSLTPITRNPQVKENLGAGPKWANTEMTVLERIAKWFALNRPESLVKIKPYFDMLLDSELIKRIKFEVSIEEKDRFVKLWQDIDTFKKFALIRHASDLAQGTAIVYSLLHGIAPVSQQVVKTNSLPAQSSPRRINSLLNAVPAPMPQAQAVPVATAPAIASPTPVRASSLKKAASDGIDAYSYPNKVAFQKSIVQTKTVSVEYDYDHPWNPPVTCGSSGTGFVVMHEGMKYVVTNAHCVENAKYVTIRFANESEKYEAKVKCVAYQCDLALLEIDDPEFQNNAIPAELGEMIRLEQKVMTAGFPMGGDEISISKGITSRIEVRSYCMSGFDMLQVQIDAAVNPGNSGGPVFSYGKVVGVAFQGYNMQGLGYMIPIPIINHFLKEAFSNKPYRGFPILPVDFQPLENPRIKKHYDMTPDQSGFRVEKIYKLCDAANKLQVDDIVLQIDEYKISHDGTVNIPGIGNRIDFLHVTHMKYIGDSVRLKVLRKNKDTKKSEILDIDVILDRVPQESQVVPAMEYDKTPTFYINSGIAFQPLTRNLMDGKACDFEEYYIVGEGNIAHTSKSTPDQQIVVISEVFDCKELEGYLDGQVRIVKNINGRDINNIHDVVLAMETPSDEYKDEHVIINKDNSKIVIERLTRENTLKLIKRYHITNDRSEDLMQSLGEPMNVDAPIQPQRSPIVPTQQMQVNKPKVVSIQEDEIRELDDDNDIKERSDSLERELTADMLPGRRKYLAHLDEMETRYLAMGEEDEEDDDFSESLGSDDDDDSNDEVVVEQEQYRKVPNRNRLFQRIEDDVDNDTKRIKRKKPDDDDIEESNNKVRKK